jgi:hypothetical protein
MNRIPALTLLAVTALTSCSIQLDSQYGIRFEPAKIEAEASRTPPHSADEWTSSTPTYSAPETAPESWSATSFEQIGFELPTASQRVNYEVATPFEPRTSVETEAEVQTIEPENAGIVAAAWPKIKPERSMNVAWVLWAIPAVLILLAGGGLLLNFGAHWYYLGYRRKGMAKTVVWALTLAVFSLVVFFASVLGMNLLAALIALILLLPLAVIQIVGLVKDFFALQNIVDQKVRGRKQRIV